MPAGRLRADAQAFGRLTGWGYFPVAFAGRLPFAMMIVGVLTLVATARGSVAGAGIVAAAAGIGTAACGPGIGALADRVGQRPVLIAVSTVSILAGSGLLVAVAAGAALPVLVAIAIVLGGSTPQVSPFSRSRLVAFAALAGTADRRARATSYVMSYESIADEASFVLGPVLVGVLTALLHPAAPLVVAMVLTATVVVAFALRRVPAKPDAAVTAPGRHLALGALLRSGGIPLLILAMFLVGGVFGSTLTAVTAFMRERGQVEEAGIVYGAMSVGAIAVALAMAALPARFTLAARWPVFAVLAIAGSTAMAFSDSSTLLVPALVLSGCGVGAVLVTLFSLGAAAAPDGRSTTVLTALQSTLVVGQALVTAFGGALAEALGSTAGFTVAVGLTVGLLVLGGINRRRRASTA